MQNDKFKSYLPRFEKLSDVSEKYKVKGNLILVEKLPRPEHKTKGGIITSLDDGSKQINSLGADTPYFCRVLDVGEGYTDDNGEIIPNSMTVSPGDIVLVPRLSVKFFSLYHSMFDYQADTIGLVKESEIQMHFSGQEGFDAYFNLLNKID